MQNFIRFLACGAILFQVSCTSFGTGSYFKTGISSYSGDGTILDTSQPAVFFATRGYRIDLPEFRIDRPYEHTYQLKGIPVINDTFATIYFELPQGLTSASTSATEASFDFNLVDRKGSRITRFGGPLNTFIWSSSLRNPNSLYNLEGSLFQPKPDEEYRLHVRYHPGSGVGKGVGHVSLRCGIGGS